MEPSSLINLVDEADSIYSADKKSNGMQGIVDWMREDFTGYKKVIYYYLCNMNSRVSTARFSLDCPIKKEMLEELLSRTNILPLQS